MPRMSHEAALGSAEPPRRPAPRIGVINARGVQAELGVPGSERPAGIVGREGAVWPCCGSKGRSRHHTRA
jgi:hypothetical protein